jgi:hypothetical protein
MVYLNRKNGVPQPKEWCTSTESNLKKTLEGKGLRGYFRRYNVFRYYLTTTTRKLLLLLYGKEVT